MLSSTTIYYDSRIHLYAYCLNNNQQPEFSLSVCACVNVSWLVQTKKKKQINGYYYGKDNDGSCRSIGELYCKLMYTKTYPL